MKAVARGQALEGFAAVIRRCRKEAGYRTARAFYVAQGGKGFFGCSYKAYANLEAGVSVPQPRLLERVAAALRLGVRREPARKFSRAYLRLILGSAEFLELAAEAVLPSPDEGRSSDGGLREESAEDAETGPALFEHPVLLRASEAELRGYFPQLSQALERTARRAAAGPAGTEGEFALEVAVVRLLSF